MTFTRKEYKLKSTRKGYRPVLVKFEISDDNMLKVVYVKKVKYTVGTFLSKEKTIIYQDTKESRYIHKNNVLIDNGESVSDNVNMLLPDGEYIYKVFQGEENNDSILLSTLVDAPRLLVSAM